MKRIKNITIPSGKWTIGKIEKLVKIFATFGKSKDMRDVENMSIALALVEAEHGNKKLTLKETKELISAFNKARGLERNAIKKYLILATLLVSNYVTKVKIVRNGKIKGFATYKSSSTNFMKEPMPNPEDRVGKISVYGLFGKSYLGVPKIVGKIQTGFCRCSRYHEVNKIEVKKILDLKDILRLNLKANELIITPS